MTTQSIWSRVDESGTPGASGAPGAKRLELRFQSLQDRHQHSVLLHVGNECELLLQSVEGDDQQCWPSSPPLQQLSIESRESGDVALLVGMAGKSHWSLSVESLPGGCFEFQAACRLAKGVMEAGEGFDGWLGSSYQFFPSALVGNALSDCVRTLEPTRIESEQDQIAIVPGEVTPSTLWSYRVCAER